MTEPAFRGTLLLLQNRTRRDPESYRDEFLAQLDHFRASSATVLSQRTSNPQFIAVLNYVCHVSHCFPKDSVVTVNIVLELLRASKGNGLPSDLRLALVKSLILLRAKDLVSTDQTFPLFFELLQERDKTLRKLILTHVVSDIRKVNMPGAKNGALINKKAQNFLFSVMAEDDPVQARCAEMVMIDLYRRRVWSDERTVEVLTKACFSKHTTILRTALRFFLLQMPKITSVDDEDDDEEEQDPGRTISKMKQKLKIVKKTSKRERVLKRGMREVKRKYNRQEKEEELFAKQHVDPIRLLRDPQQFVERLLAKLQKTSERFEIRLLYLNVIARTISEHEVIHLPLYPFLERYMEPSQLHATQLLALSAMCVHKMIPPDTLEPMLRTIANHFVSDRSSPDAITVGINTIREICKRQPLAMNADLLKDLAEYKNQRGDKGVMMAARALIQLYRDVYPELLPAKLRGSKAGAADMTHKPVYGAEHVYTDIPGLELLYQNSGSDKDSQDGSDASSSSSDEADDSSSGSSGEWATDSDSEVSADDVEGEFVDASDTSSDDEEMEDGDAVPQLVPVHKHGRSSHGSSAAAATAAAAAEEEEEEEEEEASDVEGAAHKRPRVEKTTEDASGASEEEEEGTESDNSDFGWEEASDDDEEVGEDDDEDDSSEYEEVEEDEEGESEEEEESKEEEEEEEATDSKPKATGEEAEEEEGPFSLSKALANAPNSDGWFEDVTDGATSSASVTSSRRQPSITSSKASNASVSSSRMLTDSDFEKIRQLQAQHGSHLSLRGKLKERDARAKKKHDLIHGISNDLDAHDIEHFTERKRETDKQAKIEQAQELRKATSKFELRRKKKSKLNSTHGEHSKRGKLFQMTKRSQRVATKLRSSVADRATRAKEMKKKDIKFRIKRGWKA